MSKVSALDADVEGCQNSGLWGACMAAAAAAGTATVACGEPMRQDSSSSLHHSGSLCSSGDSRPQCVESLHCTRSRSKQCLLNLWNESPPPPQLSTTHFSGDNFTLDLSDLLHSSALHCVFTPFSKRVLCLHPKVIWSINGFLLKMGLKDQKALEEQLE